MGGKYTPMSGDQLIYLLRHKSDTFEAYKTFESWANTQLNRKIKVLHSDRGGEYLLFTILPKRTAWQKYSIESASNGSGQFFMPVSFLSVCGGKPFVT